MSTPQSTTLSPRTKEQTDWIGDLYRLFETADGRRVSCLHGLKKSSDREVLLCLAHHWGRTPGKENYGNCWLAKRSIAAETALNRRTVQRSIKSLVEKAYIFLTEEYRNGAFRPVYPAGDLWGGGGERPPPLRRATTPPAVSDHPPPAVSDHPPCGERPPEVEVEVEVYEVEVKKNEVSELQHDFFENQNGKVKVNGNGEHLQSEESPPPNSGAPPPLTEAAEVFELPEETEEARQRREAALADFDEFLSPMRRQQQ